MRTVVVVPVNALPVAVGGSVVQQCRTAGGGVSRKHEMHLLVLVLPFTHPSGLMSNSGSSSSPPTPPRHHRSANSHITDMAQDEERAETLPDPARLYCVRTVNLQTSSSTAEPNLHPPRPCIQPVAAALELLDRPLSYVWMCLTAPWQRPGPRDLDDLHPPDRVILHLVLPTEVSYPSSQPFLPGLSRAYYLVMQCHAHAHAWHACKARVSCAFECRPPSTRVSAR